MGILALLRDKEHERVALLITVHLRVSAFCRSILADELFAFIDCVDVVYTTTHTLQEMFGARIELTLYTDSRSVYSICDSLPHKNK